MRLAPETPSAPRQGFAVSSLPAAPWLLLGAVLMTALNFMWR